MNSTQIQTAIDEAKAEQKRISEQRSKVWANMEKATKKLQAELKAAEAPFRKSITELEAEEKAASTKEYALYRDLEQAKRSEAIAKATKGGQHDDTSAWSFLANHRIPVERVGKATYGDGDGFSLKKKLKNGLSVFRSNSTFGHRKYFVFDGMRLVAYWDKRNSEHRGDDEQGKGWIGQAALTYRNDLEQLENDRLVKLHGDKWETREKRFAENKFFRRTPEGNRRTDVTTKQFLDELEKVTPKALPSIVIASSKDVLRIEKERDY